MKRTAGAAGAAARAALAKSKFALGALAIFAWGSIASVPAQASVIQFVSMEFQSGAQFTGNVTFADDYSYVLNVTGTLTGYVYGTFGYVGSGSDAINWVWENGFDYAPEPSIYGTFLMDGPGSGYNSASYYNWIAFTYDFSGAPTLTFASLAGYGNGVDYQDPMVSGSMQAVPGPIAGGGLMSLVMAFGGLLAWARRRWKVAEVAT